jgi:hypothetical protein
MNVKKLRDLLADLPDDLPVLLYRHDRFDFDQVRAILPATVALGTERGKVYYGEWDELDGGAEGESPVQGVIIYPTRGSE